MDNRESNDDKTRSHTILANGVMVHHYRIAEKIGAGGMGEVYLADDTKLERQVALKFLPAHLADNKGIHSRFVREAQTLARLNHPNIVSIHEVNEYNGRPFYVMELIRGATLKEKISEKSLSIDQILDFAIQLCQGLGEAHRAGTIHRDVKPANITVGIRGEVKLIDFGLAAVEDVEKLTRTGTTLGTVGYMSPEQVSGREVDHRSDLFSLGIVLYELISGKAPFDRSNEGATLKAIVEEPHEPLARYKANVPDKLQEIVSKLLDKDPELRYQSAEGVIADLKRLVYDSQPSGQSFPQRQRNKATPLIGIAVVLAAAIAGYFYLRTDNSTKVEERQSEPMIAVMPFENLGSAEDEYFAAGMTDEIMSRLAGIEGIGLVSRSSVVRARDSLTGMKEIGQLLNVQYILAGSVRWSKSGEMSRVRITPRLIRVDDDRHLWSKNYQQDLSEVFAVQTDIANQIVAELGMTLTETERENLSVIPTESPKAYDLYLKAFKMYQTGDNENRRAAQALLDSAVMLDSSFVLAWALRSEAYASQAGLAPTEENGKIGLESARRALELEPNSPYGHRALGWYYYWVEANDELALEHLSKAKSELSNDPELLRIMAEVLEERGELHTAIDHRFKAARIDPLNPRRHSALAGALADVQRFEEAVQYADRALTLDPTNRSYHRSKARYILARTGDVDLVRPVIAHALENCDTLQVYFSFFDMLKFFPEWPADSVIRDYLEWRMADTSGSLLDTLDAWGTIETSALELHDGAARRQASHHDGFFIHRRGLLLSFVGDCDSAVICGLKGKEFVEKSDCSP